MKLGKIFTILIIYLTFFLLINQVELRSRSKSMKKITSKTKGADSDFYESIGPAKYLFKGLDIRRYDPLRPNEAFGNGQTNYILKLKANPFTVSYDPIKTPEGIKIANAGLIESSENKSHFVKKISEFKKEFGSEIGLSDDSQDYAFTLSDSYKNFQSLLKNNPEEIKSEVQLTKEYDIAAEKYEKLFEFTQEFKDSVQDLPAEINFQNSANINKFKMFFNKYGTHIVKEMFVGGAKGTITTYKKINNHHKINHKSNDENKSNQESITSLKTEIIEALEDNRKDENNEELSHTYSVGSFKDTKLMVPIKYSKLISILDIAKIDPEVNKKFEGLTEYMICLLESDESVCGNKETKTNNVVYAVTDIELESHDPENLDNYIAVKLIMNPSISKDKIPKTPAQMVDNTNTQKIVYQKKDKIILETSSKLIDPKNPPRYFKYADIPKDYTCLEGRISDNGANTAVISNLCWGETNNLKNGYISDFAIINENDLEKSEKEYEWSKEFKPKNSKNNYVCQNKGKQKEQGYPCYTVSFVKDKRIKRKK